MVDLPPSSTQNCSPVDWSSVIGDPTKNHPVPNNVELPSVDKPPSDNKDKEELLNRQTAADMEANRGLREKYADKAHNLATGCLSMWAVLLGANGVINALQGREMWSDKVIIAVTTGVTVSVLAAFLGVIRGLFPNHNAQKK